jgi:hypothetical protein
MKNKLSDLNNHLFEQLERLNDDTLTGEKLDAEIKRASAMAGIGGNIVGIAKLSVEAMKLIASGKMEKNELPAIFSETKQLTQ